MVSGKHVDFTAHEYCTNQQHYSILKPAGTCILTETSPCPEYLCHEIYLRMATRVEVVVSHVSDAVPLNGGGGGGLIADPSTRLVLFDCSLQCERANVPAVGLETGTTHITACRIVGGNIAVDVSESATCHIKNCDISFNNVACYFDGSGSIM